MNIYCTLINRNIMAIEKYFRQYFKTALKGYGFSTAEGLVLLALYGYVGIAAENSGKTQEQLVTLLHLDKAEMTRTTKSLESKGYIIRFDNPSDSRSFIFKVTEKALAFQPILLEILSEWNNDVLSEANPQMLKLIDAALENMLENAKNKVTTKK